MADDLMTWLYIAILIPELFGFGLFMWWWIKAKSVSAMYVYMTFFFLASAVEHAHELTLRHVRLTDGAAFAEHLAKSWIWPGRMVLVIVVMWVIVGHMGYRFFIQRPKLEKELELRENLHNGQ